MSAALALDVAQQIRQSCKAAGYDAAVAIADRDGTLRILLSGDTTSAPSVEAARRKARTSARFGFPTAALTNASRDAPAYVDFLRSLDPELMMIGGGMPIRIRGELVGAAGVGGAPRPESDEACLNVGLTAIASRLK
ncbi:MAG: heme-binding protein [Sphingomicrobium sp.]